MLAALRPLGAFGLGQTSSDVQQQIIASANQYGVDPNLALAVAKQESGYQQTNSSGGTLTSSAGALGVFQLMPSTAASLGVDPNNQQQNIQGGVQYLSQLLNKFNGNVSLALAAYNSGPGNVQKYGGVPPFPETQNYVSSIMSNYQSMGDNSIISQPDMNATAYLEPTQAASLGASISDTVSSIDWTDPTTIGITVAAAAVLLYALA